MTLYIH